LKGVQYVQTYCNLPGIGDVHYWRGIVLQVLQEGGQLLSEKGRTRRQRMSKRSTKIINGPKN